MNSNFNYRCIICTNDTKDRSDNWFVLSTNTEYNRIMATFSSMYSTCRRVNWIHPLNTHQYHQQTADEIDHMIADKPDRKITSEASRTHKWVNQVKYDCEVMIVLNVLITDQCYSVFCVLNQYSHYSCKLGVPGKSPLTIENFPK